MVFIVFPPIATVSVCYSAKHMLTHMRQSVNGIGRDRPQIGEAHGLQLPKGHPVALTAII